MSNALFPYVLFDFDGTLIDTNELIIACLNDTAQQFLQRTLTTQELHSILGKYLEEQMRCLSQEHCQDMVACYNHLYKSRQDAMTTIFPGIRQMLQDIHRQGCRTAVVSAKGRGGIEHGLAMFEIAPYIDVIISAYDVENNKPHPEPAIKAMEQLHAQPSHTLLVGDSPYDILCARNAGITSALAGWTIFPKESLLQLQPDYVAQSAAHLTEIILHGKRA